MMRTFHTPRLMGRAACVADSEEVWRAATESLAELERWVPWAREVQTLEASRLYARECEAGFILGSLYDFNAFLPDGTLVSKVAAWPAAGAPELLELGYWRRSGYAGLGYGREAVLGLMRWCLAQVGVSRFRIRCDEANAASRHLAEALGFSSVHVCEEDFYGTLRRQHLYEREVLR
jgi:RimJ/RimL family protein N-acetyltransferase